ncbi:copper-binding protein [Variovorax sp. PCZ-1]|uniref:copper-binding protein n=1 Tax=Variovorax sp. PCZ-1 TaxID=2835533 RepID=UPI001BD12668|nr:copper-binding protein [Variovorax sp. PCZ-1]MBS7809270.1 copper-binding protein [Variovorax sp. PCZ-1]
MKSLSLLTAAIVSFAAFNATAQTVAPASSATTSSATKEMTTAEVRKVDKDAKKVTLKHGQIKNLDMPPMTMVFQVRDDKLLEKLVAGDNIRFTAEQLQGAFVVTAVEKVEAK